LTRLTEDLGLDEDKTASYGPRWVAPAVTWLASPLSADVTGQVIESSGLVFAVAEGWRRGPATREVPAKPEDVDVVVRKLLSDARPRTRMEDTL
jgi:hypothetical protein